jgi:hypothetical protein
MTLAVAAAAGWTSSARASLPPAFSCVDGDGKALSLGVVLSDEVDREGGAMIPSLIATDATSSDSFGVVQVIHEGAASFKYTVAQVTETSDLVSLLLHPDGTDAVAEGIQELRIPPSAPDRSKLVRADGEHSLKCEAAPAALTHTDPQKP